MNRHPVIVALDTPVVEAIALLNQAGADSCVLVVDGKRVISIFTETDVVRLVATGQELAALRLREVVDVSVPTLIDTTTQPAQVAWELMRQHRIRHLPVVDPQGALIGLVSQADLMAAVEPIELAGLCHEGRFPRPAAAMGQLDHPLQTLAENSPYIIFRLDRQLRHSYISPNVQEACGIAAREFLGKTGRELGFPVEAGDAFGAACQQVLALGTSVEVEFQLFGRTFNTRLIPEYSKNSKILSILGISEDITERNKLALDLQKSQNQLSRILDNANVAISCFRVNENRDFEYEFWSTGCEALFGFTIAEFAADKHLWLSRVLPEDLDNVIMPLFEAFFAEKGATSEYRFRCKDGSIRWFLSTYVSRKQEAGYWLITTTNTDITSLKEAELLRQRSQDRLRFALQVTRTMYFEHDLKTNHVRYTSFDSDQDVQGITTIDEIFEYAHPEDQQRAINAVKATIAHCIPLNLEFRIKYPQETDFSWKLARGLVLLDEYEQPELLVGVSIDVTERKITETALDQLTQELQLLYDKAPCGYHSLDGKGRIIRINETELNMLGYTWDEMMGRNITEFLTPESIETFNQHYPLLKQNSSISDLELKVIHRSGKILTVRVRESAVYDSAGNYVMSRCAMIDVSEQAALGLQQNRVEAALRVSEEQRRLALDLTDTAFWDWDLKTGSVTWSDNMFKLLGLPMGLVDASYAVWQACVHPDDLSHLETAVTVSLRTKTLYWQEYRVIYPDESIHWVMSKGHGIYDDADQPVRMLGITLDITDRKLLELALQENEARLRLALDATETVCWYQDLTTRQVHYTAAQPAQEQSQTISLDTAWDRIHPDDRQQAIEATERAIAQPSPLELECRFRERSDHDWQWMLIRGVVMTDKQGTANRLVGVAVNITKRKQVEQALQASEEKFRQFATHLDAVLWMARPDDLQILYVSPAYEKIVGRSCESFYADPNAWLEAIHPDDREIMATLFKQQSELGSAQAEYRIVHPDGSIHWIWHQGFSIRDQAGDILYYGGIAKEITDRKQAEQALRQRQKELQTILNNAPAAIYLFDRENRFLLANQHVADLASMSIEDLVGKSLYDIWPSTMADSWVANNQQVLNTQELIQAEETVLKPDGLHTYLTVKVPFFDATGVPYAICGISTDVTAQKS